jgi:murein hydrolase activator
MYQKISVLKFRATINAWIDSPCTPCLGKFPTCLNTVFLLFFLLFLCPNMPILAQNKRAELEQRRQKLLQQINAKNQELGTTQKEKTAALDRLEMLQDQIETRESLINNLHDEVSETDKIIDRTEGVIISLNEDRERLRVEYSAMLRRAYKMKLPNSGFVYMLSAKSFEDSYKKWQYFRQYDKFRKRQALLIRETQQALETKNEFLVQQRREKQGLVGLNERQKDSLDIHKKEKDRLLQDLKSEENRISGELKSAQQQSSKLNAAIADIISEEIAARRRAAEERRNRALAEAERLKAASRKTKKTSVSQKVSNYTDGTSRDNREGGNDNQEKAKKAEVLTESNENLSLSSDFRSNKGKLPPPAAGTIVRGFGKQKVLDKVTAVNNGIDIHTAEGAEVHAVFGGTVSVVSSIAGLGTVVLIQHGNYYTVYSNMAHVSLKKGDKVALRQNIGRAATNTVTNQPEVHFEVWLERTQLNPSSWLAN